MNKSEMRQLRALVARLQKEATKADKKAQKLYNTAGREDGTGDEGWSAMFRFEGQASGLSSAAGDLRRLLDKLETRDFVKNMKVRK